MINQQQTNYTSVTDGRTDGRTDVAWCSANFCPRSETDNRGLVYRSSSRLLLTVMVQDPIRVIVVRLTATRWPTANWRSVPTAPVHLLSAQWVRDLQLTFFVWRHYVYIACYRLRPAIRTAFVETSTINIEKQGKTLKTQTSQRFCHLPLCQCINYSVTLVETAAAETDAGK